MCWPLARTSVRICWKGRNDVGLFPLLPLAYDMLVPRDFALDPGDDGLAASSFDLFGMRVRIVIGRCRLGGLGGGGDKHL